MKIFSPVLKGTTTVSGGTTTLSGSFTGSLQGTSSYATNADLLDGVHLSVLATTGSNQFNGNQTVTGSLTTTGTITAQTLVVQTVTSSVSYLTGSTQHGQNTGNTHQFTGSVLVSGSQTVNGPLNSGIITANSAGSTQLFLKSTGGGSNRDWQWQSNETVAGDISLMQSTTAGGATYSQKLNINPSGNVVLSSSMAVGTTLSAWGSPFSVTQYPYGSYSGGTTSGAWVAGNNNYYDGTNYKYTLSDYASLITQGGGDFYIRTATTGTAGATITWSEKFRVTNGGDVDVSGGAVRANGGYFRLATSGGTTTGGYFIRKASWLGTGTDHTPSIAAEGGYGINFYTNGIGTEKMVITSAGNVGIGITNPTTSKLEVNGTATVYSTLNVNANATYSAGGNALNIESNSWAIVDANVKRQMQRVIGYVGDYEQHVILLHPVYNGTLVSFCKAYGSIHASRGATYAGRISDTYEIDTSTGYNSYNGMLKSNTIQGRLYTCTYGGVKYLALIPGYRTSAVMYHFDGYIANNIGGETLKIVTYRMSNNGTIVNSEIYNSLAAYTEDDTFINGLFYPRQGVRFANGATTLNAYEEGTWTPTIDRSAGSPSVSYSDRQGTYTRIGNIVHAMFDMTATSISGGSGFASITGLPYTVSNTQAGYGVAQWRDTTAIAAGASSTVLKGFANKATNYIYIQIDNTGSSGFGNNGQASWNSSGRATGYVIYTI